MTWAGTVFVARLFEYLAIEERAMSDDNQLSRWWKSGVPDAEKPGLRTLGAVFVLCMLVAALAKLFTALS